MFCKINLPRPKANRQDCFGHISLYVSRRQTPDFKRMPRGILSSWVGCKDRQHFSFERSFVQIIAKFLNFLTLEATICFKEVSTCGYKAKKSSMSSSNITVSSSHTWIPQVLSVWYIKCFRRSAKYTSDNSPVAKVIDFEPDSRSSIQRRGFSVSYREYKSLLI